MMGSPFVVFSDVAKRWNGQLGVEHISLEIEEGSFVALLGPSGCGKSTSLRLLAGLELPDEGTIKIDGRDVTTSAASDRNLSMVFQSYALFPHLSVAENVIFGLRVRRIPKVERQEKMSRALKITGLEGYENRKPGELSGGQRQQVAVGRALMTQPKLLMLDEPTAGVSPIVMDELFDRILEVAASGIAILMVEQNARQALNIADHGFVMVQGQNAYTGTGEELLANPEVRRSFLGG